MCLDAHAHGMRIRHDIFNTPNKVKLTINDEPTPSSYARYTEGKSLGKTMPMWRVQTEGYTTDKGQLVGIVSSPSGFFDSPDVEWISGGVNSKGPNSIAIGRHGNFFQWGFAASPTYLTDEAKDVFTNAVHYIAKFDRQGPIARTTKGTMVRSAVDDAIDSMSDESYAQTVALYKEFAEDAKKRNAEIQKRIDAEEEVSDRERQMLEFPPPKAPDRMAQVMRFIPEDRTDEFQDKPEKATKYLRSIKPYLRPSGYYTLAVDEDLQKLGIANSDIAMLEKGIELLGGDEKELGHALLARYTDHSFKTKAEWTDWLKKNRSNLFFTEAGGYKWLVNTIKSAPAAQPQAKATRKSPFASVMSVRKQDGDRYTVRVDIDILDGWHAYDFVPASEAYVPLTLVLDLPTGVRLKGKWKKPTGRPSVETPGVTVFGGRLTYTCELVTDTLGKPTDIGCTVQYQVCDDQRCLRPTKLKLDATLTP